MIAGFTAGIAIYIFSTQVKDFLGLRTSDPVPAEFIGKVEFLWHHLGTVHWPSTLLALAAIALIRLWPQRWAKIVPASIIAVVAGTMVVAAFNLPVETIGSRFGIEAIPRGLPAPALPEFQWEQIGGLVRPALTIALLAAIESLLCAAADSGRRSSSSA